MTVIYTPIDIEFEIPDERAVIDWFEDHKIQQTDYWEYEQGRHEWCYVALRKEPESWRTYQAWLDWSEERKPIDDAGLFFHPGFEERFPGLAKCVRELPFDQIGTSGFIMQIGTIPPHSDAAYEMTEPRRYIIYCTDPAHNTFHLVHNGKKIWPTIDAKYRCFAFNNNDVEHAADSTEGRPKILLSTVGIMNKQRHEELLERSITKFADKVIRI